MNYVISIVFTMSAKFPKIAKEIIVTKTVVDTTFPAFFVSSAVLIDLSANFLHSYFYPFSV